MNFAEEITRFDLPKPTAEWVVGVVGSLQERIAQDAKMIESLIHQLNQLRRGKFGQSSEKHNPNQGLLFETNAEDIAACEAKLAADAEAKEQEGNSDADKPENKPKRPRAGRQPLPEHLKRVDVRHELPSCTCGACGKEMAEIGEDVTEKLSRLPAQFFVERHIYPKVACRCCETIKSAPAEESIIPGGQATPELLAWVAGSKYVDHLPLYRLAQQAERENINLPISTLASWVGRIGVAFEPLADRLKEILLTGDMLHADETPVQQLDPGKGKTKRAYLWAYRSNKLSQDPTVIVFDYQPGRSGEFARQFLGKWRGRLLVDDYAGYKALFRDGVVELGCMAHARRKFFDLHASNQNPIAAEALRRIAELYAVESQAKEMSVEQRAELRNTVSRPALVKMYAWLMDMRKNAAPGSAIIKALDYSLRRWEALARYAEDGITPIDNNPVENTIRPIAIGKKNWLFAGSESAGRRAAAIQSLIHTARANKIEPMAWLADTIRKLPTWPNSRIDELLPLGKAHA